MSILIKNMEMPKNCHECRLYEGDIYYCSAADKMIDISDSSAEKCQFCPLVPVPPHGRLGDLDALIAMLERQINNHEKQAKMADTKGTGYTNDMYICDRNRDIIPMLKTAPTIIPAEEGE